MKPQKEQTQRKVRTTDKNFKMPNQFKNMLGAISDPHLRGMWKRSFVQAAVALEEQKRAKYVDIFVNARNFKENV